MLTKKLHNENELSFLNCSPDNVSEHLAARLANSELALFLGSGVSRPLQVPSWEKLVKDCCDTVEINSEISIDLSTGNATEEIQRDILLNLMQKVRNSFAGDDRAYNELVKQQLYKDILPRLGSSPLDILKTELLIAIGMLVARSHHGSVSEIITYNFDGLLEWYLGLLGLKTNSIQHLPSLIPKSDVNIYHPHGFLPVNNHWVDSETIVFDKRSYEERFDLINPNPWWKVLEHIVYQKQLLLVGIRELDPTLGPFFRSIKRQLKGNFDNRHLIGFWIFHERYRSDEHIKQINEYACVPLYFSKYEDISLFLLRIRQIAAGLVLA